MAYPLSFLSADFPRPQKFESKRTQSQDRLWRCIMGTFVSALSIYVVKWKFFDSCDGICDS